MSPFLVCLAAVTFGWNTGYQPLPDGGLEYIIQLDDPAIESLRDGGTINSDVPSNIGDVRSFQIVFGKRRLPQRPAALKLTPPKPIEPPTPPTPSEKSAMETKDADAPTETSTPWVLLLLALFASIGGNVFLAWITFGLRRRCQAVQA